MKIITYPRLPAYCFCLWQCMSRTISFTSGVIPASPLASPYKSIHHLDESHCLPFTKDNVCYWDYTTACKVIKER